MDQEWDVETRDGCTWIISWLQEAQGFLAQGWPLGELIDDDEAQPAAVPCTCPGPDVGIFDTLETIEAAIGEPIPGAIRAELLLEQQCNPIHDCDKDSWDAASAFEIERLGDDGVIWSSFAPTWAEDPMDPRWDVDD